MARLPDDEGVTIPAIDQYLILARRWGTERSLSRVQIFFLLALSMWSYIVVEYVLYDATAIQTTLTDTTRLSYACADACTRPISPTYARVRKARPIGSKSGHGRRSLDQGDDHLTCSCQTSRQTFICTFAFSLLLFSRITCCLKVTKNGLCIVAVRIANRVASPGTCPPAKDTCNHHVVTVKPPW